jgi:hypothetical protein
MHRIRLVELIRVYHAIVEGLHRQLLQHPADAHGALPCLDANGHRVGEVFDEVAELLALELLPLLHVELVTLRAEQRIVDL